MSKGWREGREVVINGFSVLGFCKAVQGLTGFSMRMAYAWGQEWLIILPHERYNAPPQDIAWIEKCTNRPGSVSNWTWIQRAISKLCDGQFQSQKASSGIRAYDYLILFNKKALDTQQKESSVKLQSDCIQRGIMLEPVSVPCKGKDVLLNTVQVWHPTWHLYNQCSLKAGDLWLFSIFCNLQQSSGSFLPQHQSWATLMQTISALTRGGRRRQCFYNSQWSAMFFPRDVPLLLPLSASAHQGLSFGSWIFHAGVFAWSQLCVTPSPGRLNAA